MLKFNFKTGLKIAGCVFLLYLAIFYWEFISGFLQGVLSASTPLIAGCVIAYLLNILMSFYERHFFPNSKKSLAKKSRRPLCLIFAFLTMLGIIALIIGLIVPQLIECSKLIISKLPGALSSFINWADHLSFVPANLTNLLSSVDWQSKIGEIAKILTTGVGGVMDTVLKTLTSVFSGIVTAVIGIIFAIYLLCSKERLGSQIRTVIKSYLPEKIREKILYVSSVLNDCFHRYIVGQCTEAVILGSLCTVGMMILRLPYASMIGALIAFTALIPIAGAYIGAAIGAFLILSESPTSALIFLIFLVILQQFEGNVIYPKVVGSSLGLPGLWVLAAVTVGGGIMGIGGLLIGVPISAAIYRIIRDDINRRKNIQAVAE